MSSFSEFYKARNDIEEILKKDLVGPVFEEEVVMGNPNQDYIMGKLYPKYEGENEVERGAVEVCSESYDTTLSSSNMKEPSTMGITFTLKNGTKKILADIDYAFYEPLTIDEIREKGLDIKRWKYDEKKKNSFWIRKPRKFCEEIELEKPFKKVLEKDIELNGFIHKVCKTGEIIFTLVLINHKECQKGKVPNSREIMFQPHIKVYAPLNCEKQIFTQVMRQVQIEEDMELLELDLLYRHYKCYGQGHGCSVNWGNQNANEAECQEPDYIESTFIPKYNLLQMKAQESDRKVFQIHYLYTEKAENIIDGLREYMNSYYEWIEKQRKQISFLEPRMQQAAKENIDKCESIRKRIIGAIDLLEKDSKTKDKLIWKSFVYTNEAMYRQRVQQMKNKKKSYEEDKITWYPFQLAYILLEIPSIIEQKKLDEGKQNKERRTVDLLWFPTGGGKTEAYLGIAAFTIFYRRLKYGEDGEGVGIIMRYTLRFLTMQQFRRASSLICACELIRRERKISKKTIEIGLWVGNTVTPGTVEKAKEILEGKKENSEKADPYQIRVCPWCGSKLNRTDYKVDSKCNKLIIKCQNKACNFNDGSGLPVRLIDEEIYTYMPAFVIATVDKFAQIALNSNTAPILGAGSGYKYRSPELIIQDELHLISGPLGTMTGIYEAAITRLCESKENPVKIIASTATIRNAQNQIRDLYGREYSQFPPQGLTADDSFFAVKSRQEERPARLYMGCMAVGTSFTTLLVHVYASWLFASRYLIDRGYADNVIDNYWTLTGYFNSLRELGGATTQILDDVQSRYSFLKESKFAHLNQSFKVREPLQEEITSNTDSEKLNDLIDYKLEKSYKKDNYKDVYDFILASNMISVGVDVSRLGTMVVAGQPKTSAEYIQATSRVGRTNPGLVITLYNHSKSRDRSHYEQFLKYHSAMYRYVEAASLTPFSERARDRGLQALFVILCRYMIPELQENEMACNFTLDSIQPKIEKIEDMILEYVDIVDKREHENVLQELHDIEEKWREEIERDPELCYGKSRVHCNLLKKDIEEAERFRIMNSMRSVERQGGIYLLGE